MNKNVFRRIWSLLLAFALTLNVAPAIVLTASAADLDSAKLPSGISASYEGDTSNSQSITWTPTLLDGVGQITGEAKAGTVCSNMQYSYYTCDTTLTIQNTSGSDKILEFNYAITVYNSNCQATVAGTTYKENKSGEYSKTLAAGASITINLKTEASENSTVGITITGLQLVSADSDITVTFAQAAGGSYTVDNTAITQTTQMSNPGTKEYSLVATPASGYSFCGWMNTVDNAMVALESSTTVTPKDGMVIKPIFSTSATAWYLAGGTHLYTDLNAAVDFAASENAKEKTVVLLNSATLAAATYTVDSGVTLVIPYDAANTTVTTTPAVLTSYKTPSAYRTLTMANGANLILDGGHLSVGGSLAASQTYGYNGLPTGALGFIKMESGSTIQANAGSFMYVIGYIYGEGSVTVNSQATVYECFQIRDFRGGTATSGLTGYNKVFPLSQYYVQNIEVPMTLNSGAIVNGLSAFNIDGGIQIPVVPFIGNSSDYMFQITNGSVVKDYIEATDRLNVKINGALSISSFVFSIPGFGGMADIDTSEYTLPINHNITVEIMSNNSLSINQDISLLPGAEILIHENATCTLGSGTDIIVYDADQWGAYCGEKHSSNDDDVPVKPLDYVAGGAPKVNRLTAYNESPTDASVMINGTVDATAGNVYVTESGANIYSTGEGELKLPKSPSSGTTRQATQDGSSVTKVEITTYPAKLTHQNRSILDTTGNTEAVTYNYAHYNPDATTDAEKTGVWFAGTHSFGEWGVSTANCTEAGTKSRTCTCGYIETVTVPATGIHNDVDSDEETGDLVCNGCQAKLFKLVSMNVAADATTELTVKVQLHADLAASYSATFEGISISSDNITFDEESNTLIITQPVASGLMTENVLVSFGTEEVPAGYADGTGNYFIACSVVDYARAVLQSDSTTDSAKKLVAAMVNYGGYAQTFFALYAGEDEPDADTLASALLSEDGITAPDFSASTSLDSIDGSLLEGVLTVTQNPALDAAISQQVIFKLAEGYEFVKNTDGMIEFTLTYRNTLNGNTYTRNLYPKFDEAGRYSVEIMNIPAAFLDYGYKIEGSYKKDGTETTFEVYPSIASYMSRVLANSGSINDATESDAVITARKNLVQAMWLYNQAAKAFFAQNAETEVSA